VTALVNAGHTVKAAAGDVTIGVGGVDFLVALSVTTGWKTPNPEGKGNVRRRIGEIQGFLRTNRVSYVSLVVAEFTTGASTWNVGQCFSPPAPAPAPTPAPAPVPTPFPTPTPAPDPVPERTAHELISEEPDAPLWRPRHAPFRGRRASRTRRPGQRLLHRGHGWPCPLHPGPGREPRGPHGPRVLAERPTHEGPQRDPSPDHAERHGPLPRHPGPGRDLGPRGSLLRGAQGPHGRAAAGYTAGDGTECPGP
jgi:hypothetical protein